MMNNLQKIQAKVPVMFYGFGEENDFQASNILNQNRVQNLMSLFVIILCAFKIP